MNAYRKYFIHRSLICIFLALIFFGQSSIARRTQSARDTTDAVQSEIPKTQHERDQYVQLQKNVKDYQVFLEKERTEHWRFINELYNERQWIAGIFLLVLTIGFILTLWRVNHNTKKMMREMFTYLSQLSQNKFAVVNESNSDIAVPPVVTSVQIESPEVEQKEEEIETVKVEEFISKPESSRPAVVEQLYEAPIADDAKKEKQVAASAPILLGFADQAEAVEVLNELIRVLHQRGLQNISVQKISPAIMQEIEKGKYDLLMCVYEPVKEQGIVMDKQLQGVVNALQYSDTYTPIIVYYDKKVRLSTWDEQAVNKYDYALLADSRLTFVNQVVLTLQRINGVK